MSCGLIPHAGPDAAMLGAAQATPKRCGHGKTWDEECPECGAVWRKDRVADLIKQAAKYGFRLVPNKAYRE